MASELKLPGGDDDPIVGDLVKRDLVEAEGAAHFKAGGIAVFERVEARADHADRRAVGVEQNGVGAKRGLFSPVLFWARPRMQTPSHASVVMERSDTARRTGER